MKEEAYISRTWSFHLIALGYWDSTCLDKIQYADKLEGQVWWNKYA